jgi:predicted transcriptional regulator
MNTKIAAYKDLLKVVKKHSEAFNREDVTLSPEHLKSVVEAMEVSEEIMKDYEVLKEYYNVYD